MKLRSFYHSILLVFLKKEDSMKIPKPGDFPFTRGIYPDMYKKLLWTMRQYAGYTSAEESNRRYQYLLKQGVSGLSVAFDLPTQIGYDSDHPMAEGEVGRVGVPISTIEEEIKVRCEYGKPHPKFAIGIAAVDYSTPPTNFEAAIAAAKKYGRLR